MTTGRLPWEIIETFPSTDAELVAHWEVTVATAASGADRARALIGRALSLYWAVQEEVTGAPWSQVADRRTADLDEALELARADGTPDLVAVALLGQLYATWGPDRHLDRDPIVAELALLRSAVHDEETTLRIFEWEVVQHLDTADLAAARRAIELFTQASAGTELVVFKRREVLWRGCLAMLDGRIDESLQINQEAISSTANVAGSPFSFQNVAITLAIERYLRRGLGDVVDAIRSIRASSPRVGANWDTGLAFALSEIGEHDEAGRLFTSLAADRFARVPRDLNWLVTLQLLGLVALTIDAADDGRVLIEMLRPYAHLDGTHGSGYASYGPVGRVVGSLMSRWGDPDEAEQVFDAVFSSRPAGPWTAMARLDRAQGRRSERPVEALRDARRAEVELAEYDLAEWATAARDLGDELAVAGHGGPIAHLSAAGWTLRHPAGVATLPSSIGIEHLVWLLGKPGEAVAVTELDPYIDGSMPSSSTSESTLDAQARSEYRHRLDQIDALGSGDPTLIAEAEFLRRELSGAAHAPSVSPELERARIRITKALRRAIEHIGSASPALGAHLDTSIETGRTCLYQPADGSAWSIVRR